MDDENHVSRAVQRYVDGPYSGQMPFLISLRSLVPLKRQCPSFFTFHSTPVYRLKTTMVKSHRQSLWRDTWFIEIAAIIISITSFIAIIAISHYYDGKPLFIWHRITINTVISIFSTVSRITLIVAVSAGLGQWRWTHFVGRSRPLKDFEILDAASRGSTGSLRLLWMTKSW